MNDKKQAFRIRWRASGVSMGQVVLLTIDNRTYFCKLDGGGLYELIPEGIGEKEE